MSETIIEKNQVEQIRVGSTKFNSHDLFYARLYFKCDDGEWRPTKKGITARLEYLPQVIEGLQKVMKEARNKGLLDE